ncbi:MAG: endonuclease/exonuclease/phosphatase family protein [Methylophagaceae bacterium]
MEKVQLLYVKNIISRQQAKVQQQLTFLMKVENTTYDKKVNIVWAGEEGIWQTLPAKYGGEAGNNNEYWQAKTIIELTDDQSLPGNIKCGVHCQVLDDEFWDNNDGADYISDADSGILLTGNRLIQNVDFGHFLDDGQDSTTVTFVADQSNNIEKSTIHWTDDNWATTQKTPCYLHKDYWNKTYQSNARNPNQYQAQLWSGTIEHGDVSKLKYAICCENAQQAIWENNGGYNFSLQGKQLKVLVLNLHCYQEQNQDEKFTTIAQAINELDVDVVCLQEVAEYWRDGEGDWPSNAAKIINDRLTNPFHIYADWSHLGFDKYREGVAILSRFSISNPEARYVSDSDDIYDIHARKVVKAQLNVPHFGLINVFSAHLSWVEDGFQQQFKRLHKWAESRYTEEVKATLLCGDFNITAGTSGYELVVDSNEYEDQYLAANDQGIFDKIFKVHDEKWQDLLADDYRIDYIFMNKASELQVTSAEVIFTEQDGYGRVSDHCGYLMTFEAKD